MTIDMAQVHEHLNNLLFYRVATKVLEMHNDSTSCVATGTIATVKFTITLSIVKIDVLEDKSIQEDLQVSIVTELENHSNFYITHIIEQDNRPDEVDIAIKVFDSLTNCVEFTSKQAM